MFLSPIVLWEPEPYCCNSMEILLTKLGGAEWWEKDEDRYVWFGPSSYCTFSQIIYRPPKV